MGMHCGIWYSTHCWGCPVPMPPISACWILKWNTCIILWTRPFKEEIMFWTFFFSRLKISRFCLNYRSEIEVGEASRSRIHVYIRGKIFPKRPLWSSSLKLFSQTYLVVQWLAYNPKSISFLRVWGFELNNSVNFIIHVMV